MIRRCWRRLTGRIRRLIGWDGFRWIAAIAGILVIGVVLSYCYWEELSSRDESVSTTVRNLGVVIGGVIAIVLAVWRSVVAESQADAALRQSETAAQGLRNERYQKAAEMLGNKVLSVRLGGIYALRRLAEEHPEEYHIQIMRLFCAFARHPTPENTTQTKPKKEEAGGIAASREDVRLIEVRMDIEAVMEAIALRNQKNVELERRVDYYLDLRGANLHDLFWSNFENVNLYRANLAFADLSGASFRANTNLSWIQGVSVNLSKACLANVSLSRAKLWGANLADTFLIDTDLSGASFREANLSRADLRGADLSGSYLRDANVSGTFFRSKTVVHPFAD